MKWQVTITGGCWPTPQQELLLRASLLPDEQAKLAWGQWQAQTDIDQLDYGSFRLLPLLYQRLRAQGVAHPWLGRLKGVYRRTWYQNQLLLHHAAEALNLLHAAGIETLVLKGAALTVLYYRDYGLRPMDDLDVYVPAPQVSAAIRVL